MPMIPGSHPHDYVALYMYMGYKKIDWCDQARDGAIPGEVRPALFMNFFLYFGNKNMSMIHYPELIHNAQVFHVNKRTSSRTKYIIIECISLEINWLLGMHIFHEQYYDTKTPNYKIVLKFSKISKRYSTFYASLSSKCDVTTGRVMCWWEGTGDFQAQNVSLCKYISLHMP